MGKFRKYARPPITEAIIDIQVELPPGVSLRTMEEIGIEAESDYPTRHHRQEATGTITLGEEVTASATRKLTGYVCSSADQKQVFQPALTGFTFSRLAPYDHFEPFRDEARRLWDIYRRKVQPVKIKRLALRYINRLDLSIPITDFKDYLRTSPEISPDLPQGLQGFFFQLAIPFDPPVMLLLTEALVPPSSPSMASILLDLDLFYDTDVAQSDGDIWRFFERLRIEKNRAFEGCITDKARELFE